MARYAAASDLTDRFGSYLITQLFDDSHTGTADATLEESILEAACDELDQELSGLVSVPLTSGQITGAVKQLTLHLAWYLAHQRINAQTEMMERDYLKTLEKIRRIGEGLSGTGGDTRPTARSGMVATMSSSDRIFGRSNMSELP